jgi:serine/threonine-protein kinase
LADPATALRTGLADRYRLERELGRGGMARVYLAHDLKHDRPVALKVLDPELSATLGSERFLREVRTAARLQHPNILTVFDSGAAGQPGGGAELPGAELLWYSMPYVEGESLRDRLRREIQLPVDQAAAIAREVAEALDYAHGRDVLHRDIKPENILLSRGHALVADFGIARALRGDEPGRAGERLTQAGLTLGTPAYMSPEQAGAVSRIDGRSDVYSLGCVLYEMLTGEPPFIGPTAQAVLARSLAGEFRPVRTVRPEVAASADAAIRSALASEPDRRPRTAGVLVERFVGAGRA